LTPYPHAKPLAAAHILFSGFTQSEARPNGILRLWRRLHDLHAGPDTAVLYYTWDADTSALAEWIWRLSNGDDPPPRLYVYGYSWGGWAAVQFCRQLSLRSDRLAVRRLVLSDPVYRHKLWIGNWRALVGWPPIRVPRNVRAVWSCRQEQNRPRGHRLVADDPLGTSIPEPVLLSITHQYADDAYAFQDAAEAASKE